MSRPRQRSQRLCPKHSLYLRLLLPLIPVTLVAGACTRTADPDRLLAADRAFFAAVAAHDTDAFRALLHEEAKFFGSRLLEGPEEITEGWRAIIEGEARLEWAPDEAHIADSGDLGYTIGTALYHMTAEDGSPEVRRGRYVSIWKRRTDGTWGAVVDIGTGPQTVVAP